MAASPEKLPAQVNVSPSGNTMKLNMKEFVRLSLNCAVSPRAEWQLWDSSLWDWRSAEESQMFAFTKSSSWCHSSLWTPILAEVFCAIGGMLWKCGVRHFSLLVWSRRRLWFLEAGCQSWLANCPDIRIVTAHCWGDDKNICLTICFTALCHSLHVQVIITLCALQLGCMETSC